VEDAIDSSTRRDRTKIDLGVSAGSGRVRSWRWRMSVGGKIKWSLRLRFLDPILLECSLPLPGIERQPEGATSGQVSLSTTPVDDWFLSTGSGFLARRTNLLSPSVDHLPVFKVTRTATTERYFARARKCCQQFFRIFLKLLRQV
jgi:hypothetical protein